MKKSNIEEMADQIVRMQEDLSDVRGAEFSIFLLSMAVLELNRFANVGDFRSAMRSLKAIEEAA